MAKKDLDIPQRTTTPFRDNNLFESGRFEEAGYAGYGCFVLKDTRTAELYLVSSMGNICLVK